MYKPYGPYGYPGPFGSNEFLYPGLGAGGGVGGYHNHFGQMGHSGFTNNYHHRKLHHYDEVNQNNNYASGSMIQGGAGGGGGGGIGGGFSSFGNDVDGYYKPSFMDP